MGYRFKKRLFGQEVSPGIINEIKNLAGGGLDRNKIRDEDGNPIIIPGEGRALEEIKPSFKNYLGEKTPFSRMWCAVNIKEINKAGEVDDNTSKIRVFSVNENKEDSYIKDLTFDDINPFQPISSNSSAKPISSVSQLQKNPLFKPEAGITSVTSKTQGSLGALQNTTVEFVVHNKHDFETIFLPFFLKPGSIVCVDYGWSEKNLTLYDPLSKLDNKDTEMSEFDSDIYGDGGFLEQNFGKVNTTMGNVVSYDASITPEGSYNCSLEILSRNAGLLDKEISKDNNLRALFTNTFDAILIASIASSTGAKIERSFLEIEQLIASWRKITREDVEDSYDKIVHDFYAGSGLSYEGGNISEKASRLGIFYADYITEGGTIRTNETGHGNEAYISLGKFEDLFLNSFVTGVVRREKDDNSSLKSSGNMVDKKKFENQYGSHGSYIRWDENLVKLQQIPPEKSENHAAFLLPNEWSNSYHANLTNPKEDNLPEGATQEQQEEHAKLKDSISNSKDREEKEKKGEIPAYKGIPIMPMRDLFISVSTIVTAFRTKSTVNDALLHICDRINQDSHNTFNIKLSTSDDAKTKISFIDANLLPPQPKEKRLVFDVMGETSIVSNCDLKFVTPKAGLSSMIAISNLTEPTSFSQVELSALNHLNLLNKPDGDKNYFIRSLPFKGDINPNIFDDVIGFDMNEIEHKIKTQPVVVSSKGESNEAVDDYFGKLDPEKESFSLEKVGEFVTENLIDPITEKLSGTNEGILAKTPVKNNNVEKRLPTQADKDQIMVVSSKKAVEAEIRNSLYNRSAEGNISPILPVELDLSVYGNKFLQIGDCYTISYLPEHYKDRTFFQIVGIEDKVDVNGWTTSYTSVMRVDPSTDRFMNSPFRKSDADSSTETTSINNPEIVADPTSEEEGTKTGDGDYTSDDVTNKAMGGLPGSSKSTLKNIFIAANPQLNAYGAATIQEALIELRTTYKARKNGGAPTPIRYETAAGSLTGIPYANSLKYQYTWFQGPNGEEVVMNSRGVKFYKVTNANGTTGAITDDHYPDRFKKLMVNGKPKMFTVHGRTIDDPRRYPQKFPDGQEDKHGSRDTHPAYKKYKKAMSSARVGGKLSFDISTSYFKPATVEEIKKHPKLMYHPYSIDVNRLGIVKNLAMMYAIRNAVFKNINFEGFKVVNEEEFPTSPTGLDDLPHATVEYTDLYDMLRLHHLHKNDKNKQSRSLDEAEVALAKVLQDFGKDNNNLEIEELKSIDVETRDLGIKVPSPIGMIQFRDDNKEAELKKDGSGTRLNTGSKVISLNVHPGAEEFSSADFPKNTLINTKIIIPAYLLENSKKDIQMIANDINRLFASYEKAINDALKPLQIYGDSSFGPD